MNINLHIERLVLDGVATSRPALLEAALAAEIARLLSVSNVPSLLRHGDAVPSIRTAPIALVTDPLAMGREIGQAIHAGFSRDQVLAKSP